MGRLARTEFIRELDGLLKSNYGKRSVYVTQKRLSDPLSLKKKEDIIDDLSSNVFQQDLFEHNKDKYSVLIRVSMNGKDDSSPKKKISTVVDAASLDAFWVEYSSTLKNGFVGLKKKDKRKTKKASKVSK